MEMEPTKSVVVVEEHLLAPTVAAHSVAAVAVTDATVTAQAVEATMVLVVKEKEAGLVRQVVSTSNTMQVRT
jgi:hypothetical protein